MQLPDDIFNQEILQYLTLDNIVICDPDEELQIEYCEGVSLNRKII